MKNIFYLSCILIITATISFGQNQKEVLVEVFTNSHCPLCPPAHAALYSFEDKDTSAKHVSFIYYHMPFPYSDDPLYQSNKTDPSARNNYYGPYSGTPDAFFDGKVQSNTYGVWRTTLDGLVKDSSPLRIILKELGRTEKLILLLKYSETVILTRMILSYILLLLKISITVEEMVFQDMKML